jgi:hypothetical protein
MSKVWAAPRLIARIEYEEQGCVLEMWELA